MTLEIGYVDLRYRGIGIEEPMTEFLKDIDADGQCALYLLKWDDTLYYCDEPITKMDVEEYLRKQKG